MLYGINMSH